MNSDDLELSGGENTSLEYEESLDQYSDTLAFPAKDYLVIGLHASVL